MEDPQKTYEKARREAGLDSAVSKTDGYSFPEDVDGCKEAFLEARTHPARAEAVKAEWCYRRIQHIAEDSR